MKPGEKYKPMYFQLKQTNMVTPSRYDTESNLMKTEPDNNFQMATEPDVQPPKTNFERNLIIPMVRGNTGFLRNTYNEEILGDIIDENDFLTILDNATKIVEFLYSKKRMQDNLGISKYKLFLSAISMLAILIFLVLIYFAMINENQEFEYISYGFVTAGLVIFSLLTAYEAERNSKQSVFKFKEIMAEQLFVFFDKENEFFKDRGLIWGFDSNKMQLDLIVNEIIKDQFINNRKKKVGAKGLTQNSK
jgi:hypothetical protein